MEVVSRKVSSVTPVQDTAISDAVSSVLQQFFSRRVSRPEKCYTLSEISLHCHWNDCWIIIEDYVYDISNFMRTHPGGLDVLMEHAGRDATVAFYGAGHSASVIKELLDTMRIGSLVQQERVNIMGHRSNWKTDNRKVVIGD